MPPPELAANAPVSDVLHPVEVHTGEPFRDDADTAIHHCLNTFSGQGLDLDEPLLADQGFDNGVAPLAVSYGVFVGLLPLQEALRL